MTLNEAYKKLGISAGTPTEEIRSLWKKISLKKHPDKGGNEEEYMNLSEAYNILMDPSSAQGEPSQNSFFNNKNFSDFFSNTGKQETSYQKSKGDDYNDDQGGFFTKGGNNFSMQEGFSLNDLFGAANTKRTIDKIINIPLTFKNLREKEVIITFTLSEECTDKKICKKCMGKGRIAYLQEYYDGYQSQVFKKEERCPSCRGSGNSTEKQCAFCKYKNSSLHHITYTSKIPTKTLIEYEGKEFIKMMDVYYEKKMVGTTNKKLKITLSLSKNEKEEKSYYYNISMNKEQLVSIVNGAKITIPLFGEKTVVGLRQLFNEKKTKLSRKIFLEFKINISD